MAHRTRTSLILEKAQKRSLALKSIDTYLDLGNGLTVREFTNQIEDTQSAIDRYNLAIKGLTQLHSEMMESEKTLADQHERMLSGVCAKYGRSSTEYEMAGGTKRSGKRKPKATTATNPELPTVKLPSSSAKSSTPSPALTAMMN